MRPLIGPKGVADLRVLRQELVKYEPGEIAHIENVMRSEERGRNHRRLRQTESETEISELSEKESTRDVQSTERFELERETNSVVQSQENFEAGVNVSASYGPVSIGANVNYSTSSSRRDAQRATTKYAKETVDKALDRVKEVVQHKRKSRDFEEVEEINTHSFDNKAGGDHISGIYRWVDKVYRNRVFPYGRRLMYEFYVPEPARMLKYAADKSNSAIPGEPTPPEALDRGTRRMEALRPDLLEPHNYSALVAQYQATDVSPPPPFLKYVSKPLARVRARDTDPYLWALTEELEVPEGYVAEQATIVGESMHLRHSWWPTLPFMVVGHNAPRHSWWSGSGRMGVTLGLGNVTGRLPVSIISLLADYTAFNIQVLCVRSPRKLAEWQLSTYQAIMTAYQRQRLDYADSAAAAISSGVKIRGRNPRINRQIEAAELQRNCIAMWLNQPVYTWPAIDYGPDGEPSINVAAAMRNIPATRLLQESFEWENMTYSLLPYHFGSHDRWLEALATQDVDPKFEQFLRAGAARVLVPVRPDSVGQVLYFQRLGRLWFGDDPPVFDPSDPEGSWFNDMLRDVDDEATLIDPGRDTEITEDDSEAWEVTVPTSLVWLQSSMELPGSE